MAWTLMAGVLAKSIGFAAIVIANKIGAREGVKKHVVIVIFIIACVVASFYAMDFGEKHLKIKQAKENLDVELAVAANKINSEAPKIINDVTRMDGASYGPGAVFKYRLTFYNHRSDQITKSDFSSMWDAAQLKRTCETMSKVIDRDVQVIYEYRGIDGKAVGQVELSKKNCQRE
jgi:hypothetical protein